MSLRTEWQQQKAKLEKAGIKMTDIADKAHFGPALDDYDKKVTAFDKTPGTDPTKLEKARKEVGLAIDKIVAAGSQYTAAVNYLGKHMQGHGTDIDKKKQALTAAEDWLVQKIDIIQKLRKTQFK